MRKFRKFRRRLSLHWEMMDDQKKDAIVFLSGFFLAATIMSVGFSILAYILLNQ